MMFIGGLAIVRCLGLRYSISSLENWRLEGIDRMSLEAWKPCRAYTMTL